MRFKFTYLFDRIFKGAHVRHNIFDNDLRPAVLISGIGQDRKEDRLQNDGQLFDRFAGHVTEENNITEIIHCYNVFAFLDKICVF